MGIRKYLQGKIDQVSEDLSGKVSDGDIVEENLITGAARRIGADARKLLPFQKKDEDEEREPGRIGKMVQGAKATGRKVQHVVETPQRVAKQVKAMPGKAAETIKGAPRKVVVAAKTAATEEKEMERLSDAGLSQFACSVFSDTSVPGRATVIVTLFKDEHAKRQGEPLSVHSATEVNGDPQGAFTALLAGDDATTTRIEELFRVRVHVTDGRQVLKIGPRLIDGEWVNG